MSSTSWKISGDYMETCSCDYICPCMSDLAAEPTLGRCDAALAFRIDQGSFGGVNLDRLKFIIVLRSPGAFAEGNMTVGLITDERASAEQQEAILGIASGQAGGPMAALGPLIGNFAGVKLAAINYGQNGISRTLDVPNLVTQGVQGVPGADPEQAIVAENVGHPVTTRLALGKSTQTHIHAFGIDYDSAGGNNAHFAPFSWKGEG
jgi:hypothetical protein